MYDMNVNLIRRMFEDGNFDDTYIDCPECGDGQMDDDQYQCTTCWCGGMYGRISMRNVVGSLLNVK